MLNPLTATRRIEDEYRRYLRSTFPLRDPALRAEFAARLDEFALAKGPYLQASAPFEPAASVRALVEEGLLSDRMLRLPDEVFPVDRQLYQHQELAIRKAVSSGRNLLVATGTGSGKTECFLLPILDSLMREREQGTLRQPGVRALLLYPMNALANDQLKRLRALLAALPEITFGRYVGETQSDSTKAEDDFRARYPYEPRIDNELLSRERMQAAPPHILLTNFAMLEYLLLRPQDSSLFDGETAEHWRFLALDEVHVYSGAEGTELAMLMRRLRDRVVASERGRLQCFGTSATLGRGVEDYPQLAEFGTALFDELFEWSPSDDTHQDIIGPERKRLVRAEAEHRLDPQRIAGLHAGYRADASLSELAECAGPLAPPLDQATTPKHFLAELLERDERVIALQELLEQGAVDLRDAAEHVFPDGPSERIVELIDLGVAARRGPEDAPLIPARYHFFVRALEGAFVCLHPEHPAKAPRLLLARHDACPACAAAGRAAKMFELGVCRRCGGEYAVGSLEPSDGNQALIQAAPLAERPVRMLLGDPIDEDSEDEDDEAAGVETAEDVRHVRLCPGCGELREGGRACSCDRPPKPLEVALTVAKGTKPDAEPSRRCVACGRRATGDIVYRFITGTDAPVSVIATDLYQEIPPSDDRNAQWEIGQGRKLLTFSDSRQDAAFFAPYLERTYGRAVERRMIAKALERSDDLVPQTADLILPLVKAAEEALVLDPDRGSRIEKQASVATWLMRELLAFDRRQSLEGTAVADIALSFPRRYSAPAPLLAFGLSEQECEDLLRLLLDTLRDAGALTIPDGVDITSDSFAPRNREIFVRREQREAGVIAWLPARASNTRLEILRKVFARRGIDADPREVLAGIWRMLTEPGAGWENTLAHHTDRKHGSVWRLAHDRFEFRLAGSATPVLRCDSCGQLFWRTVADICPTYRCDGTLAPIDDVLGLRDNHYARLYRELEPIGMSVEEHTAQWISSKASEIQEQFVRGKVNVLSCSTTFELGVDVGEVQAVLLRNVPPSPSNYVQRAGRAGRRTDSAALVVCFAQRRSHDLTYFQSPRALVEGMIAPPRIVLDNPAIARRHMHSVAFAQFQRDVGSHHHVQDFFLSIEGEPPRDSVFVDWLRERPASVGDALEHLLPEEVKPALAIEDWGWVEALVRDDPEKPSEGWLARAGTEVREDAEALEEMITEAAAKEQFGHAAGLQRVREGLVKRFLLNFLASRNVLPKYGFPVDVVELQLARSGDAEAASLELSRDLSLAIGDYAPGTQTVAGKALWVSRGLVVRQGRAWPVYAWGQCDDCGAFRHGLQELPAQCPTCGATGVKPGGGKFAIPIWGFAGRRAKEVPGESRPPKRAMIETFFGAYRGAEPELTSIDGLPLKARFSHQGLITVINRGPFGAGFRVCDRCGYSEPITASKRKGTKTHTHLRNDARECTGMLQHLQLGHEYLTDVFELRLGRRMFEDQARSVLYALLEACPALDIARKDIDGTIHWAGRGEPAFVLFDNVPGGAGHTRRIGARLPELIAAARDRVANCECGEETSCYNCLRSYGNQLWHDSLSRGAARAVLDELIDA